MTKLILTRALRRALLLSLTASPLACGGNVAVDEGAGGSTGTGGSTTGTFTTGTDTTGTFTTGTVTTGTVTPGCVLVSTTPTNVLLGGCAESFAIQGTPADCGVPQGGPLSLAQCEALCPEEPHMLMAMSCSVSASTMGPGGATLACQYSFCTGRRPPGLAPTHKEGLDPVARFLAEVAHLEAASVIAFDGLAAELEAHGAPGRLVLAARRSAREEVRHAEVTRRLAGQAGAIPDPVVVDATAAVRSLEDLARDNAVEGCVRETFGALVGMHQARKAGDPEVRRAMDTIARDETRHAALSWELAAWLDGELDDDARRRVRAARDRAVEDLLRELATEPHPALVADLGLPTAAQARAAAADLRASLWS